MQNKNHHDYIKERVLASALSDVKYFDSCILVSPSVVQK